MFFVAGITGHVGGTTAQRLLDAGKSVRTLARTPEKAAEWARKGVEVRSGDLTDATALTDALTGVEGAFLLIPPTAVPQPGYPEAKAVIASFESALRKSPPPRLVLLSSMGSERDYGLGNITSTHLMEAALGDLPFPTAFVRAGSFYENYLPTVERAAATGWFESFQPVDLAFPMVGTADIGAEAARLLLEGWDGNRIIELGSKTTPEAFAQGMGEAIGREVHARAIPREAWTATLEAMGFPSGETGRYEEMMDGINSGWIDFGISGTEPIPATLTPAEFFRQA